MWVVKTDVSYKPLEMHMLDRDASQFNPLYFSSFVIQANRLIHSISIGLKFCATTSHGITVLYMKRQARFWTPGIMMILTTELREYYRTAR